MFSNNDENDMNKIFHLAAIVAVGFLGYKHLVHTGEGSAVEPVQTKSPATLKLVDVAKSVADYSHRGDANIARDVYRHPFETLNFFGVKSTHKVVEILPGSGWYTEILAPKLKDDGQLIAAHYPKKENDESYRTKSRVNFEDKLKLDLEVYGEVAITDFEPNGKVADITTDSDFVLTFRGLHGLENSGQLSNAFNQFNAMLKDGGKLGVVQHEAPEGSDVEVVSKLGYLPQSYVVAEAEKAGFKFVASSTINNNPKDIIIQEGIQTGVWTLPPSLRGEGDVARFKEIGESNRMTLLFVKQ